jgi:hypothetical protein
MKQENVGVEPGSAKFCVLFFNEELLINALFFLP